MMALYSVSDFSKVRNALIHFALVSDSLELICIGIIQEIVELVPEIALKVLLPENQQSLSEFCAQLSQVYGWT